jgi:transcriptional regulator GlxA family with amidase domain
MSGNRFQASPSDLATGWRNARVLAVCQALFVSAMSINLTLTGLVEHVNMTARTFARAYVSKIKRTPARSVEAIRPEAACGMLEASDMPLKRIAADCGIGDEQNLRRAFQRQFGVNPLDYRARFAAQSTPEPHA